MPELTPHHLAGVPLPHAPRVRERLDEDQPPATLVRPHHVRHAVAAVVDLDAKRIRVGQEAQEVAAAGRDAVQEGVGGEFADAQQDVVRAVVPHAPVGKRGAGELPGGGDGLAFAAVEVLAGFQVHKWNVAESD